jgi:hypothetical protein
VTRQNEKKITMGNKIFLFAPSPIKKMGRGKRGGHFCTRFFHFVQVLQTCLNLMPNPYWDACIPRKPTSEIWKKTKKQNKTMGVFHTVALPFTLKKAILRQKKNFGNSNISPCKNIIF